MCVPTRESTNGLCMKPPAERKSSPSSNARGREATERVSRTVSSSTVESAEWKEPAERFQQHQEVSQRTEDKEKRELQQGSVGNREDRVEERCLAPPGPRAELSRKDLFPTGKHGPTHLHLLHLNMVCSPFSSSGQRLG